MNLTQRNNCIVLYINGSPFSFKVLLITITIIINLVVTVVDQLNTFYVPNTVLVNSHCKTIILTVVIYIGCQYCHF